MSEAAGDKAVECQLRGGSKMAAEGIDAPVTEPQDEEKRRWMSDGLVHHMRRVTRLVVADALPNVKGRPGCKVTNQRVP